MAATASSACFRTYQKSTLLNSTASDCIHHGELVNQEAAVRATLNRVQNGRRASSSEGERELEIGGSLNRSQVCQTQDEVLEASDRWKAEMIEAVENADGTERGLGAAQSQRRLWS
jgi:hypothetical protein